MDVHAARRHRRIRRRLRPHVADPDGVPPPEHRAVRLVRRLPRDQLRLLERQRLELPAARPDAAGPDGGDQLLVLMPKLDLEGGRMKLRGALSIVLALGAGAWVADAAAIEPIPQTPGWRGFA